MIRRAAVIAAATALAAAGVVYTVAAAPSASASAGDTHFVTATDDDVFDAVNPANASFLPVDRISRMTGGFTDGFPDISMVTVGNQIHLLAAANGGLLHSIRGANGTWSAFTNVPLGSGILIFRVVAVNVGGQLHAVLHSGSQVYHAARSARGVWTTFIDIETQTGPLGDFFTSIVDVAAAGTVFGRMELVVQTDGSFFHTTRRSNGSWDGWDKVSDNTGNPGHSFLSRSMSLAPVGNDVHLVTLGTGAPFHAVRSPDGTWTRFGNVYGQSGDPSPAGDVRLTTAEVNGNLLIAVQTSGTPRNPAQLVYTIRRDDGRWTPIAPFPGPPNVDIGIVRALAVAQE